MAISKLTAADFVGKGVCGLADTPGLSAAQMQNKFEELSKDVITPKVNEIIDELTAHEEADDNPHTVTAAQIGLGAVDNTADLNKPVSLPQSLYIDGCMTELDTHLATHTADRTNPHQVTAAQVGVIGKNLLHNWDFTNPVNQRGATNYTGGNVMGIDRWLLEPGALSGSGKLSVKTGYVSWTGQHLAQKLPKMAAGTYTFSVDCSSRDTKNLTPEVTVSGVVQSGTAVKLTANRMIVSYTFTLASDCAAGSVLVGFDNENARYGLLLYRAKLESGTESTLSAELPSDFSEQAAICRQYYQNLTGSLTVSGITVGENQTEVFLPFGLPMCAVPTVSFTTDFGTATATASIYGVKLSGTAAFTVHDVCADAEL